MSAIHRYSTEGAANFALKNHDIDIRNLNKCIQDAHHYSKLPLANISIPDDSRDLIQRLQEEAPSLPKMYQENVALPLIQYLQKRSGNGARDIDLSDLEADAIRAVFFHTGKCVYKTPEYKQALQSTQKVYIDNSHLYCGTTRGGQEMTSDLYMGPMQYEDNAHVAFPNKHRVPPLMTWGTGGGPYTWPIDQTRQIGLKAAIVSFPLSNSQGGILAWTAFAHEVAGHDLLHAENLLDELKIIVSKALSTKLHSVSYSDHLTQYWSDKIDETASDVLGLLNLGPAAGIGLIGYFRALNENGRLRTIGPQKDSHPAAILRGLLAAEVIKRLPSFSKNEAWSQVILKETLKDYPLKLGNSGSPVYQKILLGGVSIPYKEVRESTRIVAEAIMNTPLKCLKDTHCLKKLSIAQVRAWDDQDEANVANIQDILTDTSQISTPYPADNPSGYFAEHVVAAATMEALKQNADIPHLFKRMIDMLQAMNRFNPLWKGVVAGAQCRPAQVSSERALVQRSIYSYQDEKVDNVFTSCWPSFLTG